MADSTPGPSHPKGVIDTPMPDYESDCSMPDVEVDDENEMDWERG